MPLGPTRLCLAVALCVGVLANPVAAGFIIDGTVNVGQTLSDGTGVITDAGRLSVPGATVAINVTGTAGIDNSGVIEQTGTGRAIDNNSGSSSLMVINRFGASITSADADTFRVNRAGASVTLDNNGLLQSLNGSAGGNQVLDWTAITTGSNWIDNRPFGVIEATAADAVRPGANGVINNAGIIRALPVAQNGAPSGSDGIDTQSRSGVQITNSGLIGGRHGITGGSGTNPIDIVIDNEAGGTITGVNGSGVNIDGAGSSARMQNWGLIEGRFDAASYNSGDGDGVDVDGLVELDNWGTIRGLDASPGNHPEGVSIGGGTVRNHGGAEISGNNRLANGTQGNGLLVDDSNGGAAFAATTLTNAGLIRGHQGFAVKMIGSWDDTIDNQAGGVLHGAGAGAAVQTGGGNDQLINAGHIIGAGGAAVDLGDGDDELTILGGAAGVQGSLAGGAGNDRLTLDLGNDNRFSDPGGITGFETVFLASGRAELAGSIDGALRVGPAGILAPGGSVGQLDVLELALTAGAILAIDLDPRNSAGHGSADQVRASGGADLGLADLVVSLLSLPTRGEMFTVLSSGAGQMVGRFAEGSWLTVPIPGRPSREWWVFDIVYGQDDVRLIAVGTPVPASLWLLAAGLLGLRMTSAGRRWIRAQ